MGKTLSNYVKKSPRLVRSGGLLQVKQVRRPARRTILLYLLNQRKQNLETLNFIHSKETTL